ncbi:MAG TPA: BON domain-containing protein [Thermoguttaceae bacterium]|nr:BON domain-containing protein [Thermoguttaceae bacterium]
MRINRLTAAVAGLFVLASSVDVEAQVRPRPRPLSSASQGEYRSPFGPRSLGFPVYPKPSDFGGGGQFGPRPNFKRGYVATPSFSFTEDFASQPAYGGEASYPFNQTGPRPFVNAAESQAAIEPQAMLSQQPGQMGTPSDQLGGQAEPLAGQTAQNVGQPGEMGTPLEGIAGAPGPDTTAGMTGAPGIGEPSATPSSPARFQWRTDFLRGQRAEPVLVERLRRALSHRLRSPLVVTIDDQTAILRGVVATDHDRVLAGHVARFEPGVLNVKNELEVAATASP